jgi:hypothetical protein
MNIDKKTAATDSAGTTMDDEDEDMSDLSDLSDADFEDDELFMQMDDCEE